MADYETMQNKLKGILADILGEPAGNASSAAPKQADPVADILNKLTAGAGAPAKPAAAAPAGEADPVIGRPVQDILKVPEDQRILTKDKALVQKLIDSVVAQDSSAPAAAPAPAKAAAAPAAKVPAEYGPKDPIIGRKPKDILRVPEDQRILTHDMSLVMQLIDSVVAQDGCAPADCADCKMACDAKNAVSREDLVKDVLSEIHTHGSGKNGIYDTPEEAVAAAEKGYKELQK